MKQPLKPRGFALIVTLVMMALIVTILVAYLANTRTDRSTSSIYASRLRAKMMAESGLASATKLLYDNTKAGNYITAMPAPSPSPAPLRTEIYRPDDSTIPDDYLRLNNAIGEILGSRVSTTPLAAPTPQVDPRPVATPLPAPPTGSSFGLVEPGSIPSTADSFDFNQIVRIGNNNVGRLVDPSAQPAFGQWIRIRNSTGELIGRYAFFAEDESMNVNVNVAGNNLGPASSNLRVSDGTLPAPSGAGSQIQEIDPSAVLPALPPPDRVVANSILAAVAPAGSRLSSKSTIALLDEWKNNFPDYAHIITCLSKDENSTARGWQRPDLNALVASATSNAQKVVIATRIADWIRDAWTGPTPLAGLQNYQMLGEEWLRLQIAANIVDYIDTDSIPTDMGDVIPAGYPQPIPIIGIEKLPYLVAVEVLYEASNSNGATSATMKMKLQFRFINLFETPLDLASSIARIEVEGVPVVSKNGNPVFDVSSQIFAVNLSGLQPVNGTGTTIPAGINGTADSGARTFQTGWLITQPVTFSVLPSGDAKPRLAAGKIAVKVFGTGNARLDDTAIVCNLNATGYNWSGSSSTGDFLKDLPGPFQVASINLVYGTAPFSTTVLEFGDPRYRGRLVNDRWRNITRTDATTPPTTNRVAAFVDKAEINSRAYAADWYDSVGNRPLAFIRDAPMLDIGELGNIAAAEYPWRTIYLQQPERPANTTQTGPTTEVPQRRSSSVDYVLLDLFRAGGAINRTGSININTRQKVGTQAPQNALAPLFLGVPVGTQTLAQAAIDKMIINPGYVATSPLTVNAIFDRRNATDPPMDNNPLRPFFQIGEFASSLARLISLSDGTTASSRSQTVYSVLLPSTTNYQRDTQVEQAFRQVSNAITTRSNVFRVLYVGQAIKDINGNGTVDSQEIQAEYLGEAFLERQASYLPGSGNPDILRTSDSAYRMLASRTITE